jgi:hypothetical protein
VKPWLGCGLLAVSACARLHPQPVGGVTAISDELATRWLAGDVERASGQGAGPATVLATGAGAAGDSLGGRVTVGANDCSLFLVRGSRTIEDLDLFVYGDDGTLLAGDETGSKNASAVVCPPHPERIYAFARVAAGRGIFGLSAQIVAPRDAPRVANAVGAAGKLREQAVEGSWPGLEEALAVHRRALGGEWKDVRRIAVPLDPRVSTRTSAAVDAGQCIDALAVPSEDVAFVELSVEDAAGRIVGRAPSEERLPSVRVCAAERAEITLELRPHAGRGLAALLLSSSREPGGILSAPGTVLLDAAARDTRAAAAFARAVSHEGYGAPLAVARGSTGVGRRVSVPVDLPDGCARLDVITTEPSRGIDAWLWDGTGTLIAHADGGTLATLFGCGKEPHARLDVEAVAHPGPFSVELRATTSGVAPLFGQHPLAAGRVLGRLSDAGRLGSLRALSAPHVVPLGATRLVTDGARVSPGECLDVALGLGPGAEGAELRLFDATRSEELTFVRGTYGAVTEACALADKGPLDLRIEMHVAVGTTDAVLVKQTRAGK